MANSKSTLPNADSALIGRATPITPSALHAINSTPLNDTIPDGFEEIMFGMGCFWGAERLFWQQPGTYSTAVGYSGGFTPNPSYEEVCSGKTGHTEVVRVIYNPVEVSISKLLTLFWENHNPTQGMRQGNDQGTQYRSAIYTFTEEQSQAAKKSQLSYQSALQNGVITTEVADAGTFYFAEDYHQQYLAKNPGGYCGLAGTGICMPPEPE
ncbi:peptide-methionine (S)-S-oxide reductase MsrA [Photobacterium minamisatsumaniensis]|uniref:peptide-methionine (S)-S-oxide reductase MsrA n=1 Tax=Photobacterium minamisatsumaniensis TaxID=2910233 RepID=UPI003D0BE4C0